MSLKGLRGKVLWLAFGTLAPTLTSCGILDGGDASDGPVERRSQVDAQVESPPPPGTPFFSLTSTSAREEGVPGDGAAHAAESSSAVGTATEIPRESPAPPAAESYGDLVSRLEQRLEARWTEVAGGLGETPDGGTDGRKVDAAGRLIAVSFLGEPGAMFGTAIEEAVSTAAASNSTEHRLLAAAYLIRTGSSEAGLRIVREVTGPSGEPEMLRPEKPFGLASLAFAKTIEGPGRFSRAAASEIAPGKAVLVYGEFEGAAAEREAAGGKTAYRRSFTASLRLLTEDGRDLERLDFLPEGRGSQVSSSPDDVLNFWARYKIPTDLQPGRYRVQIQAKDLVGGSDASAEMDFVVSRTAGVRSGS